MKKTICLIISILVLLCAGCVQQPSVQPTDAAKTSESATIDPALLPAVFEDVSDFIDAGKIDIVAPQGATEVTQIILFDEISQVQFMFNDVFYTYRAAFTATGRTGYDLTGIVEDIEYVADEVHYTNEAVAFGFEAHKLDGGNLLLWSDGEINYSLASFGGTFEDLSAVADLILK